MVPREAYPNAADAVEAHEGSKYPLELDKAFAIARKQGWTPSKTRGIMLYVASTQFSPDIIEQMRTDDFLRYVAAKLGAV